MIISFKKDKIEVSSKRKWLIMGIVIAILNPIFSGLVVSFVYLTEVSLRKEGKIILIISLIWAVIFAYLINWLMKFGYI